MTNISTLVARFIRGDLTKIILPWQIDIDLTNLCNQDCYYCNSREFRESNTHTSLTVDDYVALFEKLSTWSTLPNTVGAINNVIFSGGGEPTLFRGYERIIAAAIDAGFFVAMNTNGTNLHKLLSIGADRLRKMAYIGLDIDAGNIATYERIRQTKSKKSIYDRVKQTATELSRQGAPVDVKVLLLPENTTTCELVSIFEFASEVQARSVHMRPGVINSVAFPVDPALAATISTVAASHGVPVSVHVDRHEKREYKRCHQMFLFPSFCADGNIYLCCEYKGQEQFKLAQWVNNDFRTAWCGAEHRAQYNSINTAFCKPCRPNSTNNIIEKEIVFPSSKNFI